MGCSPVEDVAEFLFKFFLNETVVGMILNISDETHGNPATRWFAIKSDIVAIA